MSKIFEALQKAGLEQTGGIPEQARPEANAAAPPPETQEPPAAPAQEAAEPRIQRLPVHLLAGVPGFPFNGQMKRAGEQYRIMRTKIVQHPRQPRMLVVSSAGAGDGKTLTSINLAGALALKSGVQVLLVDADFRRSAIARFLGLPAGGGLAEVLAGSREFEDAAIQVESLPNLSVLTSGTANANPVEMLDSAAWKMLCTNWRRRFKYVVMDAPPIAAVADYDLIQAACDGVVVVIRPDHSNRRLCRKALEGVPKEKLLGVVLNQVEDWFLWRAQDSYSHYVCNGN